MSDIQRYSFVGNWDGGADENENHNGDYVKYDDHIAELNAKCLEVGLGITKQWNDEAEKLQARIDELLGCLRQIYLAKGVTDKCRAHIDKVLESKDGTRHWPEDAQDEVERLEKENAELKALAERLRLDDAELNQIKAEGIREMVSKEFYRDKSPMRKDEILEYADKLESEDGV